MDIEYIILSDITKSQKEKLHVLLCVWNRVNFVCAWGGGDRDRETGRKRYMRVQYKYRKGNKKGSILEGRGRTKCR